MQKDPDQRLEELARQKLEGKSYSRIREELRISGMDDEAITKLIRQVDEKVLNETLEMGSRHRIQQWYRWGLVLAVAGLLITIGFRAGWIFPRLPALLAYSPFLAGIVLMFYGRMSQRKEIKHTTKGPGPIRKKRPYK